MRLSDYDFDLPEDRIALRPARPRDSARLLEVAAGGGLSDRIVRDLPTLLRPGDRLVFNDTRVTPVRLKGARRRDQTEARIEATLLERRDADAWTALARPAKRLKPGDLIVFGQGLAAEVIERGEAGEVLLRFDRSGGALDEAIDRVGDMPLPPYIAARRVEDAQDRADYQTLYARRDGSVAAPTAGLHFTPELLEALKARGVDQTFVTLHVGAGTFLPLRDDALERRRLHAEWGEIDEAAALAIAETRAAGGRIVAVGTTSLRLLESAAPDGEVRPFRGSTDIFIAPGGRPVASADLLMTNFHLPRSTLFMLTCAFAGATVMRAAYGHAIEAGYRFYSYGDACLLHRAG